VQIIMVLPRIRESAYNLSLSVFALLICFAVGEGSLRLFGFDRQLEFEVDHQLYWTLRPNQSGFVWMGDAAFRSPEARINNFGTRGRNIVPESTAAFRILTLGDSYTFGSGVRDEETFSAVLERQLGPDRVEVINGGVPGYGMFQVQRLLNRLLPILHPRMVIVTVPTGDVIRQPFQDPEQERRYLEGEQARKRRRQYSRLITFVYRRVSALAERFGAARAVPNQAEVPDNASFERFWQADQSRLAEMADACRAAGVMFVVMTWPQERFAQWNSLVADGVRALAADRAIEVLPELGRVLAKYPEAHLTIAGDGHPSVTAHRVAGTYLAQEVKRFVEDGRDRQL